MSFGLLTSAFSSCRYVYLPSFLFLTCRDFAGTGVESTFAQVTLCYFILFLNYISERNIVLFTSPHLSHN